MKKSLLIFIIVISLLIIGCNQAPLAGEAIKFKSKISSCFEDKNTIVYKTLDKEEKIFEMFSCEGVFSVENRCSKEQELLQDKIYCKYGCDTKTGKCSEKKDQLTKQPQKVLIPQDVPVHKVDGQSVIPMRGNVNRDELLNHNDLELMLRYLQDVDYNYSVFTEREDMTCDGLFDIYDAYALNNFLRSVTYDPHMRIDCMQVSRRGVTVLELRCPDSVERGNDFVCSVYSPQALLVGDSFQLYANHLRNAQVTRITSNYTNDVSTASNFAFVVDEIPEDNSNQLAEILLRASDDPNAEDMIIQLISKGIHNNTGFHLGLQSVGLS